MTSDSEREQQLRRLLSEAVDEVQPAPGAQTRLLAKARAQAHHRKSRRPLMLRLALPVTFACAVAIFVVTIVFATHGGERSSSTSSAAGNATGKGPPQAAEASRAPSAAASTTGNAAAPDAKSAPLSSQFDTNKSAGTVSGDSGQSGGVATRLTPVATVDLDGDGVPDTIGVQGGNLVATLSKDGVQTIALPQPVGVGSGVLGGTTLSDSNRKPVAVVFVRLTQDATAATDTMAAVVGGRLTVLRQGSDSVLLTIDPTHGYGCAQSSLAITGDTTPFVVDGSRLVASPERRGVITPAAKVTGCF